MLIVILKTYNLKFKGYQLQLHSAATVVDDGNKNGTQSVAVAAPYYVLGWFIIYYFPEVH